MSKGVFASVLASILFGALFYYTTLLTPLTGEEIFGWRMLLNAPLVTVFILASREWRLVRETLDRIRQRPLLGLGVVLCTAVVAAQFWLFMWAPMNGRGLEVSLGYFLMPLVLVLIGRVVYQERLSRWQIAAAIFALAGVTNEAVRIGNLSWETLLVAIGYPVYFTLRRQMKTDHQGGVWLEMHLIMPAALVFAVAGPNGVAALPERPELFLLIPGMGLISAVALTAYYIASRTLQFGLFGLLSYLEPVLLVFVALLLGEGIAPGQWLTYIPIWCAVGLLFLEGVSRILRARQQAEGRTAPAPVV